MSQNLNLQIGHWSATLVLTLAFFTAKVVGLIDWSWGWVFSPLWLPPAFILAATLTVMGVGMLGIVINVVFFGGKRWKR